MAYGGVSGEMNKYVHALSLSLSMWFIFNVLLFEMDLCALSPSLFCVHFWIWFDALLWALFLSISVCGFDGIYGLFRVHFCVWF